MSLLQRRIIAFLDQEMHHSLGAYRRSSVELRELEKQLIEDRRLTGNHPIGERRHSHELRELIRIMCDYNLDLDMNHDRARSDARHPAPTELPLSQLSFGEETTDATSDDSLTWVAAFYDAALHAIRREPGADGTDQRLLAILLASRANLHLTSPDGDIDSGAQRRRRSERFERRLAGVRKCGLPIHTDVLPVGVPANPAARVETIVNSHLQSDHRHPLGAFVLRALVDAHLTMHEIEAHRSRPLDERIALANTPERTEEERLLNRSVALNTLVWCAARVAPWMFAEDDDERRFIVDNYKEAWTTSMPMRAMWISAQVSLLALHRRAYTHALRAKKRESYADFHKLQHHIRDTARRTKGAPIHVDGVSEFLDGLDALADHHIGELYRQDRDHTSALTHFNRSYTRLDRLKLERGQLVMTNSRWFIQLQLSLGKASYELGQHKSSLTWFLRTWRALLDLIAADTSGEVNSGAIGQAVDWLERVAYEPELHKRDLIERLGPIVGQIEALRVDPRFTALASEILQCLGHLLFMLDLTEYGAHERSGTPVPEERELALQCLLRALEEDPGNTLAIADLIRVRFSLLRVSNEVPKRLAQALAKLTPVQRQWPGGSTNVEGMSRVIETTLLQQLATHGRKGRSDTTIARELLHSLLTHTDSIEARKSQVYEYLTPAPTSAELPGRPTAPAIEFVCLRRYSSAFPILPRPSQFRAHGGGYFVRIHPRGDDLEAYGIAIDPGTAYVECLYRSGFTLADIDVVIVTHDHVDHASSLEPLLALRHEMEELGTAKPLIVAGNESVVTRWGMYGTGDDADNPVQFFSLGGDGGEIAKLNERISDRVNAMGNDPSLKGEGAVKVRLRPLLSSLGGRAHTDLAGNPSYGVKISVDSESADVTERSLTVTSDLPAIPRDLDWPDVWQDALGADLVVCHLSTVPLAELRQMAKLKLPKDPQIRDDIDWINANWEHPETSDRLRYAQWLRGAKHTVVKPVGDDKGLREWQVPLTHPYLGGLMRIAEATSLSSDTPSTRLLVIGELSEELGSFRRKIAARLNRTLLERSPLHACTGDLGLRVLLDCAVGAGDEAVRELCSTCELDNDLAPFERYHSPTDMSEVCVKGENEGTFYNCPDHAPTRHTDDPVFVEKHERYDVYGR